MRRRQEGCVCACEGGRGREEGGAVVYLEISLFTSPSMAASGRSTIRRARKSLMACGLYLPVRQAHESDWMQSLEEEEEEEEE